MPVLENPRKEDPDVQAAIKGGAKVKLPIVGERKVAEVTIGNRRPNTDHNDGPRACSVYDAHGPIGRTSLEICRDASGITFQAPTHFRAKLPPAKSKKD